MNTIYHTETARNAQVTKVMRVDPLNNLIKQRLDKRSVVEEWDEPGSPPLRKVNIGYAGRKSANDSLGWGRRGQVSSRSPVKRRGL